MTVKNHKEDQKLVIIKTVRILSTTPTVIEKSLRAFKMGNIFSKFAVLKVYLWEEQL